MSQLLLVRHGQTAANAAGLLLGRLDPPLDEVGRAQADNLAEQIASYEPARVLTSPLQRCTATAAVLAARAGVPVEIEQRLVEIDYGDLDGVPLAEMPSDVVERLRTDRHFALPGGESLADVAARTADLLAELVAQLGSAPVVAVSHVSPIKAAVCVALGLPETAAWRMRLDTASITRLAPGPAGLVMLSFNER